MKVTTGNEVTCGEVVMYHKNMNWIYVLMSFRESRQICSESKFFPSSLEGGT